MSDGIEKHLDDAIAQLSSGEEIASILKRFPEDADELRPLLEVVVELRDTPDPVMDGNDVSLTHLMLKALSNPVDVDLSVEQNRSSSELKFIRKPVLLRLAASIAVIMTLLWGTLEASSETVPGDWLYPIKLLTEKARFLLTFSKESKVELRITYSNERLKELVRKFKAGGGVDRDILKRMLDEAKAALDDGESLAPDTKPLIIDRINNLTHLQGKTLESIKAKATPEERKILRRSIDVCMKRCSRMCGDMSRDIKRRTGVEPVDAPCKRMMKNCPMMSR